jgi:hypothetical protein
LERNSIVNKNAAKTFLINMETKKNVKKIKLNLFQLTAEKRRLCNRCITAVGRNVNFWLFLGSRCMPNAA